MAKLAKTWKVASCTEVSQTVAPLYGRTEMVSFLSAPVCVFVSIVINPVSHSSVISWWHCEETQDNKPDNTQPEIKPIYQIQML